MSDPFTIYKTVNENITTGAKQMFTGYGTEMVIIEAYALSLERQPDADLAGLGGQKGTDLQKEINKVLADARAEAKKVLNSGRDGIILVKGVRRFYEDQKDFFELLKDTDLSVREVQHELKDLYETACRQRDEAEEFTGRMATARDSFNEHSRQFKTLAGDVHGLLEGKEGFLAALDANIKAAETDISGLNRKIVLYALETAAGVIVIIVGVCLGPAGLPLVAGGVGMVLHGAVGIHDTLHELHAAHQRRSDALADKARAQRQLVLAGALEPSLLDLSGKASNAADAAQTLFKTWSSLANSLDNMQNRVTSAQDVTDLSQVFKASRLVRACDETIDVAKKLHDQLTNTDKMVDTEKDVGGMVKESISA